MTATMPKAAERVCRGPGVSLDPHPLNEVTFTLSESRRARCERALAAKP